MCFAVRYSHLSSPEQVDLKSRKGGKQKSHGRYLGQTIFQFRNLASQFCTLTGDTHKKR